MVESVFITAEKSSHCQKAWAVTEPDGKTIYRTNSKHDAVNWAIDRNYSVNIARTKENNPNPNNPAHWRSIGFLTGKFKVPEDFDRMETWS